MNMKKLFKKILNKKLILILGGIFLNVSSIFANIFIDVSEQSIAGEEKNFHISGLLANEEIGLELIRPNKSLIKFSEKADNLGVVNAKLYGLNLRKTGIYTLKISRHFAPNDKLSANFIVKPGVISAYKSKIKIKTPSLAADGNTKALFTVELMDAYENPVSDSIKVVSSRNNDHIVLKSKTDNFMIASGYIVSNQPGISVLTASTSDVVLFTRPEIVFYLNNKNSPKNVGGDLGKFLKAMTFDEEEEEVKYFTIEELSNEVVIDTDQTFVVTAKDIDGNIVNDYLGTIRFSTTDDQAEIPEDYTFIPEDQGVHKFHLGVRFGTLGEQEISLVDRSDFTVSGNATTNVISDGTPQRPPQQGDAVIRILTPSNDETRKSSRIMITGESSGVESVKIVDGNYTLVEDLAVENNGSFAFQTPNLADGLHVFRVSSLDESVHSEPVSINIDQLPPTALGVEIMPNTSLEPGQDFQITVSSTESLSEAQCNIENQSPKDLDPSGEKFVTQFIAPIECGKYVIQCSASDLIGNERVEPNAAQIQVCSDVVSEDLDLDGVADNDEINDADKDGVPDFLESSTIDSNGNGIVDQDDPTNDTERLKQKTELYN